MKKHLLVLILFCLFYQALKAQQQPVLNSGFENWSKSNLPFQVPDISPTKSFSSSNSELLKEGLTNMTKIVNGAGSAMRLQTISYTGPFGLDTSVAYAIWGKDPQGGANFGGGFPFTDQNVTGIKMDLRYTINAASPGIVIVQFKKNGVPVGGGNLPLSEPGIYLFPVIGNQATFTSTTFSFSPALPVQPDTCIIAFVSNNAFDETGFKYPGNFIEVDNIEFTGTTATVPGGNLNTWIQGTSEELPSSWIFGDGREGSSDNRTTDANSGNYAVIVTVKDYGNGDKNVQRVNLGSVIYGTPNTYIPGTPMTGRANTLGFYYKYSTPTVDAGGVYVRLTKWNPVTKTRTEVGSAMADINPSSIFQYQSVTLSYNNGTDVPDSAFVEFSSSKNWSTAVGGSTLKVDDVTFNYCNENLTVSGSTNVAMNSTGVSYSTTDSPGATFTWTVPVGATIASGNGTNSILVNFSGSGGSVYVTKVYADGCPSKSATLNVTIQNTASLNNGGFENWGVRPLTFEIPSVSPPTKYFDNSNDELVGVNLTNMTKVVNGGGFALRLETKSYIRNSTTETTMAYAAWGKTPESDGAPIFPGGFPFADQNVSGIKMDLRYNINAASPGLIVVQFKKNGLPIGGNNFMAIPGVYIFPKDGIQSSFASTTFNISPALSVQPDTCVILFVSNNPFDIEKEMFAGNYLEVDNIEFTGTSQTVPGGNLDTWVPATTDELPVGWNLGERNENSGTNKSTDSRSGNYAAQLRVIDYGGGDKNVETINMGVPIYNGMSSTYIPGEKLTGRPQSLGFYYKYFTPTKDTASVYIRLTKWNSGTKTREDVGGTYLTMLPVASYTYTVATMAYMNANIPDSAYVEFRASKNYTNPDATAGSTLTLDDVAFNYCGETLAIVGSNAVCPSATGVAYSVSATTGATYAWTLPGGATIATGTGTNAITVNFSATAGTISVTKTYADGCANTNATLNVTNDATATVNAGSDFLMCANGSANLNGAVTGAAGGTWSLTSGTGTFSPNSTTLNASYIPSAADKTAGAVTLKLTTSGSGTCPSISDEVVITITPAPTVNASSDQTVCANNANVTLAGSVTTASGGLWSTAGTGTFSPNNSALNAVYTPSAADKTAGSVSLTLTSDGNGICNAVSDQMNVSFIPAPNSNLTVSTSSPLCAGTNGVVTIASSETDVSYQAYIGANMAGTAVAGTGASISLTIPSASLSVGSNTITIHAIKATCSEVTLSNTATIVVNAPVAPTIALSDVTKTFGDAAFTITATSNSAGAFTYSFVSSTPASLVTVTTGGNVTINGAGSAIVKVDQAVAGCFTTGTKNATITINKASRTATVTSANTGTVDGTINLTNTVSAGGGTATWSVVNGTGAATVSGSTLTATGAGAVTVTVNIAADANYLATTATQVITIGKANRTATVTSANSGNVGGTIALTNSVSKGGGAATWTVANGSGSATVSGSTLTLTGAGSVTVTVNIAADANYNATSATQTITIGKGTRTATITSTNSGTVGGTIALTNTVSAGGGVATWTVSNVTGTATVSGTTLSLTGAGDVTVTVSIAADANYNATSATQTITIGKANRTASITSANTGNVDGTISLTNTVSAGGGAATWSVSTVTGSATISGSTLNLTGAGTVTVTVNIAGDANYNSTSATQTITIGKGTRTVSITSSSNGSVGGTINLTESTVPTGGTATWTVAAGTGAASVSGSTLTLTGAGTVTVRVDVAADVNYNATFATQVVTISSQPTPTIAFGDVTKTFGDAGFSLTATSNSAGAFTYSVVSSTPANIVTVASDGSVTISGAGTATVKVDQAANGSFGAGSAVATITIDKANRTATISSGNTGNVGGTINLTNTVSAGGGTATWTVANGTGAATVSGTTLALTGAGTVTVTANIAADANYNGTSANQTITIGKGTRTVAITSSNSGIAGSTITLTHSNTPSGGTATWSVTNVSGSATLSGTTLTLSGLGTVTVTVNIAADANYNAATANQTVTINATQTPQPGAFTTFTNPVTQGDMGVTYTIPNVPGTTYTWVYTGGTGVTINGTGNSVTLDFSSTATSGTLSVIAEDGSGPSAPRDMNITVTTLSAISDPFGASLKVYPNPFETTSVIEFDLLTNGEVDVEVYDMLGQRKATLMKGETLGAGSHSIALSDLTSGAYIVKLKVGNKEKNIKVIKN